MSKIVITKGNKSPSIADTIIVGTRPFDLTNCSVKFKMRLFNSDVLKVNSAAAITNLPGADGKVYYNWQAADVDTQGEYRGWWEVTLPSTDTQDSPEFTVVVDAHSEGEGVTQGEIAYQARQFMPRTWDSLSDDPRYGDRMLSNRVDYVKYLHFSQVIDARLEATTYNLMVIDFLAKEVALQIIPAGIEYWMNTHSTVTTTGTNEQTSYPDRINALMKLQEWLMREVRDIRPSLDGIFTVRRRGRVPKVGNDNDLITPNPQEFGKPFDEGISPTLPWGPF